MPKWNKEIMKRWGMIVFLLIPIVMYLPHYINGELLGNADLVKYFLGKKSFSGSLLNGEFSQWNSYLANGMPQAGVADFYPISILLSFLPLKQYLYAYYVFHLFIGSLFFYLWLRENQCSYRVSMALAIIFECSVHINGLRKGHPTIIACICLFPAIMFFVKKFFGTRQNRWLCLSAIVAALQATSAQQYSIYADLILVIYILLFCVNEKFKVVEIIKKGLMWVSVYVGMFAFSLIPILSVLREYKTYGSSATSYETFVSYSLHPIKLIMMVIPKLFGDVYCPLGVNYSTEIDIEIYVGIFVLFLALSLAIWGRKRFEVKAEMICGGIALIYAMLGNIPLLRDLVYHIPYLGDFRCAGRMLYIFCFFMFSLAGKGLQNVLYGAEGKRQVGSMQKMIKILVGSIVVFAVVGTYAITLSEYENGPLEVFERMKTALFSPLLYGSIIAGVLWLYKKISIKKKDMLLCVAVVVITLVEVLPYSLVTESTTFAELEKEAAVVASLQEKIGDGKIFDTACDTNARREGLITQNKCQLYNMAGINAYTAYNNPLLLKYLNNLGVGKQEMPFNSSGALIGTSNIENQVMYNNDFLSMLGVKYLVDTSGVMEGIETKTFQAGKKKRSFATVENLSLQHETGQFAVAEVVGGIVANQYYKITLELSETERAKLKSLWMDLYGGAGYDLPTQEKVFFANEDGTKYTAYVSSEQMELATEDVRIRIFAESEDGSVTIERCDVDVVTPNAAYQFWGTTSDGIKIYENKNAKNLLYVPTKVKKKKEWKDIYTNYEKYDLLNTAYANHESMDLENVAAEVEILSQKRNSVTAKVTAETEAYLCFSQNYSAHWKVAIDGVEQDVQMVNGLIMGTEIPEGEHTVTFTYADPSYVVGYAITGLTIVTLVVCYVVSRRRGKKQEDEV